MKNKRKIGIALGMAIVAGGAAWLWRPAARGPVAGYETARATRQDITETVTATGTVEPIIQVEVGTQVSGIINRIYVDYNSQVKKGELIAELDKTLLESERDSRRADLQAAKIEFEYQQKNYNRVSLLHEKQLVSDTEFETGQYDYEKAKSNYEKCKADMVKAETNLTYAMIYSPVDGVVLSRAVDEGQTVAASFNTPTLFTIANDLSKMQVVADVDEADIGQVENGQRVTFTVDAYPSDLFEGEVMQVRLEPTTTSNVVTYEVIVNAPNPELKLKPGLTANITLYTLERRNVLTVPAKALRFTPETTETEKVAVAADTAAGNTIWKWQHGTAVPARVRVGVNNGFLAEITEGLTAGEEVVTGLRSVSQASFPGEPAGGESSPFMPKPPHAKK